MRNCKAIITITQGRGKSTQITVPRVDSYTVEQAIDNDADSFSLDIGNVNGQLNGCLIRDNEVRAAIFLSDFNGRYRQIFQGIADECQLSDDNVISMQGRDEISSIAVDSDALPGKFPHILPKKFITDHAVALNIPRNKIHIPDLSPIQTFVTDGSEKEWAMWYRIARMKGMYMWTLDDGGFVIDKLAYSLSPSYKFGAPDKGSQAGWIKVEVDGLTYASNKQGRIHKTFVYGDDAKHGKIFPAQGVDTSIRSWRKQPISIQTDTKAKSYADLKQTADDDIFESIVGAQEIQLTVRDEGVEIKQNRMATVNLPEFGISGTYFIVGIRKQGSSGSGMTQVVRLREKGFAISKRVPENPVIVEDPLAPTDQGRPIGSIGAMLGKQGVRWADSFVRATREYGDPAGWNTSVFLAVLISICEHETGFRNLREGYFDSEWYPDPRKGSGPAVGTKVDQSKPDNNSYQEWRKHFANSGGNPLNPYRTRSVNPEAGVGPMQLTDKNIKEYADRLGNEAGSKAIDEYEGGRWWPDSNIRAAAHLLIEKLQLAPPANPLHNDEIWIGVARYAGGAWDASNYLKSPYVQQMKAIYSTYFPKATTAVSSADKVTVGSAERTFDVAGYGKITLPDNTPDAVAKALTWARSQAGNPYKWGGTGAGDPPQYDCSSFASECMSQGDAQMKSLVVKAGGRPIPGRSHGADSGPLFHVGTPVAKDKLLPGDLVFFVSDGTQENPGHVGVYFDDGFMIHDPHTGDVVRFASIYDDWYVQQWAGARRYADWSGAAFRSSIGAGTAGWIDSAGPFTVEKMARSGGGDVDTSKPRSGVLHTTEGNTFQAALDTLDKNEDWPHFLVGPDSAGNVRIAQFYPFGTASRSLKHTSDPPTNGWAHAQIELVGFSSTSAWNPTGQTLHALAALMARLALDPFNIPLSRPGGWADTWDSTGQSLGTAGSRRNSGTWGTAAGWYGHIEIPENDHWDPGNFKYSVVFTDAANY